MWAVALPTACARLTAGYLDGREGGSMGLQSLAALLFHRIQLHEPLYELRPAHVQTLLSSNSSDGVLDSCKRYAEAHVGAAGAGQSAAGAGQILRTAA